MKINQVAKTILDLREGRQSSILMQGELRSAIGAEGFAEAVNRGWVVPDVEGGSGMLNVTSHLGVIDEMRQLAESQDEGHDCDELKKGEECCNGDIKESASHSVSTFHANRRNISEKFMPGADDGSEEAKAADTSDEPYKIGEDVMVTSEGETYQGKVAKVDGDGRVHVSFGDKKPSQERPYENNELGRIEADA